MDTGVVVWLPEPDKRQRIFLVVALVYSIVY